MGVKSIRCVKNRHFMAIFIPFIFDQKTGEFKDF